MHRERLLKLAEHLEHGELGHDYFDIQSFNEGSSAKKPCGSAGCAIGECPIVFPHDWVFRLSVWTYQPRLVDGLKSLEDPFEDAGFFFDLPYRHTGFLFSFDGPGCDNENGTRSQGCRSRRNRYDVARELRAYVKHDGNVVAAFDEAWPGFMRTKEWQEWRSDHAFDLVDLGEPCSEI